MSQHQHRATVAVSLAAGARPQDIARELEISPRTIRRWMTDPDFAAEVRSMRMDMLNAAVGELTAGATEAVAALRRALSDDDGRNSVQAARVMLEFVLAMRESLDHDQRIAALESAAAERMAGA
ncbi:helix-turn-helix domain-containing protein [Saccharopolyspora cebuensis]|uniref:Helix-turn-helix domain-containing protein n=1 Tax=Saccharopolyspora cebuensis TaxID=418759 RepID=A0ABV4CEV4_9PSEU